MSETVIGDRPPSDGRVWDCQCARCGSSMFIDPCEQCGGEGFDGHDCGEDCCACLHPDDNVTCDACNGSGSWARCASGYEWCNAHPREGKESIEPDTPEWFVDEEATEALKAPPPSAAPTPPPSGPGEGTRRDPVLAPRARQDAGSADA